MLISGLVSVTFRQLSPEQIIVLAKDAALDAIEWGGDVHIPHGDIKRAIQISRLCQDTGIKCSSYGSYCRLTNQERSSGEFAKVVDTASALGVSTIRVWAGKIDGGIATTGDVAAVVDNALYFSSIASAQGIRTAYEFHGGTLTSTTAGALALLCSAPGTAIYWQPPQGATPVDCLDGITRLLPYVSNIHVFSWQKTREGTVRLPLKAHSDQWQQYLQRFAALAGDHFALLEFVADDSIEQFRQDAATLKSMISACESPSS